jgi:SAM-dependent methyltransferase
MTTVADRTPAPARTAAVWTITTRASTDARRPGDEHHASGGRRGARTKGVAVSFVDVMGTVGRWLVTTEALAALGAELELLGGGGHTDVVRALSAVSAAAGLPDLDQLPPPHRQMIVSLVRMTLRQALDLVEDAGRAPGWAYRDTAILEGWGRGSMVVPGALVASAPELAGVRSFLDIGTGIGLLAVAAAGVWPDASIVGIDIWPTSLELATDNVRRAGLTDRITLRNQDVSVLDDVDCFDCAWFPTFFVSDAVLDTAVPRLFTAMHPGGWLVLGRMAPPPDPLAEAVGALRSTRSGGTDFDAKRLTAALESAGFTNARVLPRRGPAPMEYVIGQRPAT